MRWRGDSRGLFVERWKVMQTIRSHVWLHDGEPGRGYLSELVEGWKVGLHVEETPFWSGAVGGRCMGVLVPDPCLSGAAMFTVRKEAVNYVCPISASNCYPPNFPLHQKQRQTQTSAQYISENWKPGTRGRIFLRLRSVCVCLHGETGPLCRDPEVIDRLSTWGLEFPPWCKIPVAVHQRVTTFLTRSWTAHLYH